MFKCSARLAWKFQVPLMNSPRCVLPSDESMVGPVLALVSNLMLTPVLVFFMPKMTNPSPHPLFFKDLVQHISPIKNLLTQFTYFTFTQNMYKMELKGHIHTLVHKYFQVANNKLKITVA